MTVSMENIKLLREKTGIGMMDCKKALEEANGDMERALEILRAKGKAVASKRAEKSTENGCISGFVSVEERSASLAEITCETDFAAKTDILTSLSAEMAEGAACSKIRITKENMLDQPHKDSLTFGQSLDSLIASTSENVKLNRLVCYQSQEDCIPNVYIHPGNLIATMTELCCDKPVDVSEAKLMEIAKNICMHIAVMNPTSIAPEDLPAELVEKEKRIAKEEIKDSGKPDFVIQKIIDGKLKKFYSQACLIEQSYIKDDKITIGQYLENAAKELGFEKIRVKRFVKLEIGQPTLEQS